MEIAEALVLIAAVLALFFAVFLIARNEIVRRRLTCPRSGKTAEVEVLRRFEGRQKPVKIKSCSLFEDPKKVDCEQDCLEVVS